MSSVERYMDTTLPGMATEDFPVDKQVPVNTELSEGTTIEQHAKEKKSKGKGGFVKRAWKAVKRPFRRSSHETKVEAIVPDTRVSCASSDREEVTYQLSSIGRPRRVLTAAFPPKKARWDDLDVVSITSIDWSDCNNIQQNSELPADASAEDVETQEQHVKEGQKKGKEEKGKEEKKKEKEEKREEKKKEEEEKKKMKEKEKEEKREEKKKKKEEKKKEKEVKKEEKKKQKEKEKEKEEKTKEKEEKKEKKGKEEKKKENEVKKKKKEKEKEEKKKEKEEKKEKEKEKKKKEKEKEEKKKKKEKEKEKEEKRIKKEKEKEEKKKEKEEKKKKKKKEKEEKKKKKEKEKEEKKKEKEGKKKEKEEKKKEKGEKKKEKGEKKKGKGGFFKRAWKAVKRPSHHHCHKTSAQNKPQDQHVKEEKKNEIDFSTRVAIILDRPLWQMRNLRRTCRLCRRRWEDNMALRLCSHHRCCSHEHLCCLRNDWINLGVREQIMSTVPSATRPFLIFPEQDRKQHLRIEEPEEENDTEMIRIFKRKWKAIKDSLRGRESKMTLLKKELAAGCVTTITYSEQISPARPYISVPPIFQPSFESFYSLYKREFVTLGIERFGDVRLATRKSDGLKVAFKGMYRYPYGTSTYVMAGYTERLMNEVAMMTLLKQPPISPYIIQMLEWFQEKSETIIVMEDPGSCTVLEKIIDLHPLNEKIARVILRQAVQAAQHSIAHGVFHFYITAENILINTSTLDIKLIDFGYSMPYTGGKYYRLGDTLEYDKGEAEYSVPEHEYSAIAVNAFQLGRLLRRMVYGPYDPDNYISTSISNDCKHLIDWCTRYNATQRPTLEQILQHRWFTKQ